MTGRIRLRGFRRQRTDCLIGGGAHPSTAGWSRRATRVTERQDFAIDVESETKTVRRWLLDDQTVGMKISDHNADVVSRFHEAAFVREGHPIDFPGFR